MKLLAIVALALALAIPFGAQAQQDDQLASHGYMLINEHSSSGVRVVDLLIDEPYSEDVLSEMAEEIKSQSGEDLKLRFYIDSDGNFSQYAAANYDPELTISFESYSAPVSSAQNSNQRGCDSPSTAYRMAKSLVEKQLVSPSTAEFPSIISGDVNTSYLGNCTHRVTSYVDSQNGYGAMVRTHFSATVQKDSGTSTWALKDLSTQ